MPKIEIEDNSDEVSTRVPVYNDLKATLQVRERKYELTKANNHWCILLKLEILEPDLISAKTPQGMVPHSIAGQTFNTRFMLQGKGFNGAREAMEKLGINVADICEDTDNADALSCFDNLTFVAIINGRAITKTETDPTTGQIKDLLDENGQKILSGAKWELAPWDIIRLA